LRGYVATRLLLAIPTIILITVLVFLAMNILPGDPLVAMFGFEGFAKLSPHDRQRIMEQLGFADPLWKQYVHWMQDIATGNLGESFFKGEPVMKKITHHGPLTAEIAVLSVILSWIVGLPVGAVGALKRNSKLDYAGRLFTTLFLAVPSFWLGLMVVLAMLLMFEWKAPLLVIHFWQDPVQNLEIVWGPVLVLGMAQAAYISRLARSTFLEVMYEDYIRTARAKGLHERIVLVRHTFRNAILPLITLSGILMGFALAGSVVIESVFGVRGLGSVLIGAISERDHIVIQNLVLFYGIIFILVNLFVDMSYGWLDPRIRYR
jgi:peptide/nickel transport system permease protein